MKEFLLLSESAHNVEAEDWGKKKKKRNRETKCIAELYIESWEDMESRSIETMCPWKTGEQKDKVTTAFRITHL